MADSPRTKLSSCSIGRWSFVKLECQGLPSSPCICKRTLGQQLTITFKERRAAAQGLTTLKMGWCKLGADEGAQAVADLLMFNTTLASVDLRGNGLGDAGASQGSKLWVLCWPIACQGKVADLLMSNTTLVSGILRGSGPERR